PAHRSRHPPLRALAPPASHHLDVTPHPRPPRVLPPGRPPLVARGGVLVGHDRPALLDRELALPRRHGRALALERLDLTALAHAPEPVVVAHLGDAGLVAEVSRLEREGETSGSFAVTRIAVADRAAGRVDVLAAPDHRLIGPDVQGHVSVGILEGRGHVSVAPFLFVLLTVGTDHRRVSEPEPEEQHERGRRQRYEKLGSHVGHSSEVPVDADEDLVPPVAQRTLFDKAPKVHTVPDEEGDVLPGIELRLHGKHGPVALLVLEATRPELVETTRYDDLLLHEVVGLNAETGRSAVEVAAQLARQAVELVPNQRAVDVESLPP